MTKTTSYRQHAVLSWVLPILFQITLWGCSDSQDQLFLNKAKDDAAKKFVEQVVKAPRCREIRQISVIKIDNDRNDSMQEALKRRLGKLTSWDVAPLPDSNTMNKILELLGIGLKIRDIYDPVTLITLGRMIQARYVVFGRVTAFGSGHRSASFGSGHRSAWFGSGHRSAWVNFNGQVVDLERGVYLFLDEIKGDHDQDFKPSDLVSISVGTALLFFVLGFLSHRSYFTHEKAKQALLWIVGLFVWGLAVWQYYF